jgi:hypothetical protein
MLIQSEILTDSLNRPQMTTRNELLVRYYHNRPLYDKTTSQMNEDLAKDMEDTCRGILQSFIPAYLKTAAKFN